MIDSFPAQTRERLDRFISVIGPASTLLPAATIVMAMGTLSTGSLFAGLVTIALGFLSFAVLVLFHYGWAFTVLLCTAVWSILIIAGVMRGNLVL